MPIQNDFGKFLGLSADEIQKVNNIPGLDAAIYKSYNNSPLNSAIPRTKIIAKSALTDPVAFVKKNIQDYSSTYVEDTAFKDTTNADKDLAIIKSSYQYLQANGVSAEDAQKLIDTGVSTGNQRVQSLQESSKSSDFMDVVAPIALAFIAPQLGAAIAVDLGVSAAAGTAIANTALQVAAGADPTKALENSVTNAVVQTGSGAVATEINGALSSMDKATAAGISNAAGSAISSAVTTAAKGGSQQDIIDSAIAGAAGSAATTTTGEAAVGGAVVGGLTGGTQGALTGAAGALGKEAAAAEQAKTKGEATTAGGQPSGVQLAAADTGQTTDAGGLRVDVGGVPIYKENPDAAKVKAPYGYELMSLSESDARPAGAYYDITQNAWFKPTEAVSELQSALQDSGYKASITELPFTYSGRYGIGGGGAGAGAGAGRGVSVGAAGGRNVEAPGYVSPGAAVTEFPTIEVTAEREAATPEVPVEDRTGTPVDQTDTYKPSLTTASKVSRTGGASVTGPSSTLARALQGDFYPTSTTGLTAYRPAGEIESEETGKQRQDVWNEASLRLKDALGI